MTILPLALLLLLTGPDELRLNARERAALGYLRNAEQLQMQTVGYGSQHSGGYLAMRMLLRSRHAAEAFEVLLREGTLAGQLYGLAGLKRVDPSRARIAERRYTSMRHETILVFSGCIISPQSVRSAVARLGQLTAPPSDEEAARRAEERFGFSPTR